MQILRAASGSLAGQAAGRTAYIGRRSRLTAWLLSLVLGVFVIQGVTAEHPLRHSTTPTPRARGLGAGLSTLPAAAQGVVSDALGADSPAYGVIGSGAHFEARDPAQRFQLTFGRGGVLVSSGATRLGLRLTAVGFGSSLRSLPAVSPIAHSNRVTYPHMGLSEWYANGPLGLEQGVTIAHAPAGREAGPITLGVAVSGNASPVLAAGGRTVIFSRGGGIALRYGGLVATDSQGRRLQGWLQVRGGHILIRVDARGARYPLRIDPFVQQGKKLKGKGEVGEGHFAASVALSADGSTALIGAPLDGLKCPPQGCGPETERGAAWVFTRSGETWTQQAELKGSGPGVRFGSRVALSPDGSTALIAAEREGDAWVYVGSGSSWTEQAVLRGRGYYTGGVAISSDGNTALLGEISNSAPQAQIFTRSGTAWSKEASLIVANVLGQAWFESVALSSDGNTALLGGPLDHARIGAAWVFEHSNGHWTEQAKLTANDEIDKGEFGDSVSLSSDGNTALIGGQTDNEEHHGPTLGAAWVFTRNIAGLWTQEAKLVGSQPFFGASVSLSGDAAHALIGASEHGLGSGSAYVFTHVGSGWQDTEEPLRGSEEIHPVGTEFGGAVALSSDARTALVGGPLDGPAGGYGFGAAWAFYNSGLVTTGSLTGTVTDNSSPAKGISGAIVTVCSTGTEPNCLSTETAADGSYSVAAPDGTDVATVYPPSESGFVEATSPSFTITGASTATEDFVLAAPQPPPNGTVVTGFGDASVDGVAVPVVESINESPITTQACIGGSVTLTVTAENPTLGEVETTSPTTLTETPAGSGTFSGNIPSLYPLVGAGNVTINVADCPHPQQDETFDFTIYIDPSGVVVDADNGNVPIGGATVTLLTASSITGAFTPVPNGSSLMSPANRANPDTSHSDGAFGWDTVPGFYEIEASKPGCGRTIVPAFQVPPPVANLQVALHCAPGFHVEIDTLPRATRKVAYTADLEAAGGAPPYKWKKTAALPKGLKLNKAGVLSGSPSKKLAAGSYPIPVEVQDASNHVATATLAIEVM